MTYAPLEALYASDGVAPAVRATISSTRLPGDMDVITDSVANWPHKGIATSGTPDDSGVIIPETECVFEYVLSGTIIHITGFAPGYSDVGHTENQIVILKPTTHHTDSLVKKVEDIASQPNLPAGGTTGQILTKVSSADGDADWQDASSGNSIVTKEVPTGSVNGVNTTFTTSQPYIGGSLQVYINGLAQSFEVTETNPATGELTITPAPLAGDDLVVSYMFGAVGTMAADTVDGYHASATSQPNTIPVLNSEGGLDIDGDIYSNGEKVVVGLDVEGYFNRQWGSYSRSKDTIYTNTEAYPIEVIVTIDLVKSTAWKQIGLRVGSPRITQIYVDGSTNSRDIRPLSATVPPGETYYIESISSASTYNIYTWYELR